MPQSHRFSLPVAFECMRHRQRRRGDGIYRLTHFPGQDRLGVEGVRLTCTCLSPCRQRKQCCCVTSGAVAMVLLCLVPYLTQENSRCRQLKTSCRTCDLHQYIWYRLCSIIHVFVLQSVLCAAIGRYPANKQPETDYSLARRCGFLM